MGHGDDGRDEGDVGEDDGLVDDREPPEARAPVAPLRAKPVQWFAILGTIVFVGGWAATVYVAFLRGDASFPDETAYNVQILVSLGSAVTLAAGVLWAIAAYLWVQLSAPDARLAR
jgi:hypothetical protein